MHDALFCLGYSIARSLRTAPELADAIAISLNKNETVLAASQDVWEALWPAEMRRRVSPSQVYFQICLLVDEYVDLSTSHWLSCNPWKSGSLIAVLYVPFWKKVIKQIGILL